MTKKHYVRWTTCEDDYLRRHYMAHTNEALQQGLIFISRVPRSKGAISARIKYLGLKGRPHGGRRGRGAHSTKTPAARGLEIYVPRITPVLKNPELFRLLGVQKSLHDVALAAGEHIDVIRGYVHQGGLPARLAPPIRDFLEGDK